MNDHRVAVSAVIPTRNRPELVCRAVRSVLAQTMADLECIVVIDGPDALTQQALCAMGDARIQVIALPENVGACEARNVGARAARGTWVALLDDDDEWLPEKLEKQLAAAAAARPPVTMVVSRFLDRGGVGDDLLRPHKFPRPDQLISEFLWCEVSCLGGIVGFPQTSTWLLRREFLLEVPFTRGLKVLQDLDWLLHGYGQARLAFVEEPLVIFHNEITRQRISKRVDWLYCRDWAIANRFLFTPRALAFFLVIYCVNPAAQQGAAWAEIRPLLEDVRRYGNYNARLIGLCILYVCVYPWLARALSRRQQSSLLYRVLRLVRRPPPGEAAESFWQTRYFAPLDGLRAVSLALVIASHCHTGLPVRRLFSGGLGVGIFFVLSGFLITILLLREELARQRVSLGAFYIRRAFRILPPYGLTVAAYLLLGLVPSQHELKAKFLHGLPYFLTLRNEYVPQGLPVAFTHSWSLSVEEKFYLVWPLLFFWFLPRFRIRWAVVPIMLAPLFVSTTESLPVAYFSLLLGCSVAIALHGLRERQQIVLGWVRRVPISLVFVLWVMTYFASLQAAFRLSFIVLTAALFPWLLLRRTWFSRLLGSPVCTWVGKRTYSMYLFHAICLTLVEGLLPPSTPVRFLAVVILAYGVSLAVASVIYVTVEQPMVRWGARLAARENCRSLHYASLRSG